MKSYIENTLFFVILSVLLLANPIPVLTVFLFGVFYIMIIGSIYGNRQGFLAVGLSTILLIVDNLLNGRNFISLLYDTTFLFQIATFLFIGLVVGYSVQRKNMVIAAQKEEINELESRYTFLEEIHTEVRDIKDELQMRVKNNEDSFGKIYSVIKQLDNLEPEKIFTNTVKVVEETMRCKDVSIYTFNQYKSYLRLVAASDSLHNGQHQNSIKVEDAPFVQQIVHTGKLYVNRQLQSGVPLLAAPIYYNNEIRAVITINDLSFEQLSTYHENLFIVVKELIQSSLGRAMEFLKATEDVRYIGDTNVLQYETFNEIVKSKEQAKTAYNMPYVVLSMPVLEEQLAATAAKVSQLLRETDYLGFHERTLFILLSNTATEDIGFILKRFDNIGFTDIQLEADYNSRVIL